MNFQSYQDGYKELLIVIFWETWNSCAHNWLRIKKKFEILKPFQLRVDGDALIASTTVASSEQNKWAWSFSLLRFKFKHQLISFCFESINVCSRRLLIWDGK